MFPQVAVVVLSFLQLALSLHVSRRVLASPMYDDFQKRYQLALVWLVPVIGVVIVWRFLADEPPVEREGETNEVDDEAGDADHPLPQDTASADD